MLDAVWEKYRHQLPDGHYNTTLTITMSRNGEMEAQLVTQPSSDAKDAAA